jgi:16S rRNA (cytidine1402-2'-O)-methyltransferase
MVLLIEGKSAVQPANVSGSVLQQVSQLMAVEGLDEKDALKRVARERGVSKSEVYRELQRQRSKK